MPLTALYEAVRNDDQRGIRLEIERLTPDLVIYVKKRLNIRQDDAHEAVHSAIIYLVIRIRAGLVRPEVGLLKYLQRSAEHNAIKIIRERERHQALKDGVGEAAVEYDVLEHMIDKEQRALLEACIKELPEEQQEFIRFVLDKPLYGPEVLARRFGLTVTNATVRKHRLIKLLGEKWRMRYRR
jgi:RNA polymerase sigma factor (sigma-70 family)